jgi:hypothetical protein
MPYYPPFSSILSGESDMFDHGVFYRSMEDTRLEGRDTFRTFIHRR